MCRSPKSDSRSPDMVLLMYVLIRCIELRERSHKADVAVIVSRITGTGIAGYAAFGVTIRISIRMPGF
ncbi:hypothetical protein DPMN_032840 [Dreissena polymorpha]|uniref:Uncharacterized protein n=1 Tax=Dreissena polymorpha TaxID=45954 RepID=A0A9D4RKM7_DREPO|nr:hypothetical protein DPMN_032839 [Dreissena polymorpha]KAH3869670.1 hypothetical protein DPMN_032840 [Dreissena polymorpha]